LLSNDELYEERNAPLSKSSRLQIAEEPERVSVSAAIDLLVKAGFHVIDGNDHPDKRVMGT